MMVQVRKRSKGEGRRKRGEPDWEDAPTELSRRCVFMQIYGEADTGKTTLALTAPGPIALLHASEKIEGIVQPFAAEKKIRMHDFGGVFRGKDISSKATVRIEGFLDAWYDALENWARSTIVDTDTEAYEILRLARFGTLTPKGDIRHMYGPVNAEWKSVFNRFRHQNKCNVICIGQTKDEYRGDKATGRRVRAGHKSMKSMADVVVYTSRNKKGTFLATIEKPWWNGDMRGLELEDDMITFPIIMSMITETNAEDWEE